MQRGKFEIQEETRIFYLLDVSVPAGVQCDSVGQRGLLSLGNVIFGGRPVQRASFISSTCRCQPAPNVTVSAGVGNQYMYTYIKLCAHIKRSCRQCQTHTICIRISKYIYVCKVMSSASKTHLVYIYIKMYIHIKGHVVSVKTRTRCYLSACGANRRLRAIDIVIFLRAVPTDVVSYW